MSDQPTPDRRRFLRTVGLAGLSSTLVPAAMSLAQATPPAGGPPPAAAPPDTSAAAKPPSPSEEAKALAEVLRRRYGKFLDDADIAKIAEDLDGDLKALPRLHAVRLANGDEPDFTFRA